MLTRCAVVVSVALAGVSVWGPRTTAAAQQLSAKDLAANQELDRQFVEAMSRKDLEGAMSAFWNSPDLVLVLYDGSVHRGWDNVRKLLEQMFAGMESVHLEVNEVTHWRAGDCVLAVGTATYRLQPKDGPPQQITERWTDLRRKIGGRWVYALDHAHALAAPVR